MKILKKLMILAMLAGITASVTGCGLIKPYDKPEFVTIEASQTAFLIPLIGDTTDQASFASEELLAQSKIATKEVQIPHRWVKTGRLPGSGEYRASAKLIVVERTPETREWNSTKDGGTSAKNQAIYAESKESIGFSVGMNCSCQIDTEDDAVKFLYSYNDKTLEEITDTEIRSSVESKFVEQCAKYTLEEILTSKEQIMQAVRDEVITYFLSKGITITVLGMKDGIEYDDPAIQAAINDKFTAKNNKETSVIKNQTAQEKAQSDKIVAITNAEANAEKTHILAEAEAEANKLIADSLTPELIEKIKYEKWNGELPKISGANGTIVDVGNMFEETVEE